MNNNADNRMPAVPADIAEWSLYHIIHGCNVDFGRGNGVRALYRLRRRVLLQQMHLMSNTRCTACNGFSHRARDCPTNVRLSMLGAASFEEGKLIAWARGKSETAN